MPRTALARLTRLLAAGAVATTVGLTVSACAPEPAPTQQASTAPGVSTTGPSPSATPVAPTLQPDADAQTNLAFFRFTADTVWNSPDQVSGRAYIDALVAAGFDKARMQVTRDTTTVGDAAESIQFSVQWTDGQCLIGQAGPATGALVTGVFAPVGESACLLGETRPIDW